MNEYSIKKDYEKKSSQLEKHLWGTFPFHAGNLWHSGIHLKTEGKKIHPILNGKVVAYRIRDKEKEVELSELLSEVEYKTLDNEYSTYYDSEYKLKDKQKTPRTTVSDSFVLLKHEIKRYNPPLIFYTLYMNLSALSQDEKKYYPSIKDNLNKFVICKPELDNISYIPNGFKKDGEEYIDFILFTESKDVIASHKIKEKLRIFKPIPVTEQLFIGKQKTDIKAKKNGIYLIPNNSNYVKKNYATNGTESAVEIELKSYNAMVKIVENEGKRVLKWVSASDYSEDGFKRDFTRPEGKQKTEGVEYIINLLKNSSFLEKCESKHSPYSKTSEDNKKTDRTNIIFSDVGIIENPKFWTKEVSHFNDDIGFEGKSFCFDGKHAYSIIKETYDENPFQFIFNEISKETFDLEEVEVKDTTLYYGVFNSQETQCYKVKHGDSEYFIKKDTADKYLVDAFDFSQWFIDLTLKNGKSKGIICDKKNVYKSLNLDDKIKTVIQGNYSQGDFKLLLGADNYSPELKMIRKTLRTVICKHPLEWDESLFDSETFAEDYRNTNRQTAIISNAQSKNLKKAAKDTDIWKNGLNNIFEKNEFNFFHPLYFLNYLDRIGMLEFNPYAGKTITTPNDFHQEDNLQGKKHYVGSKGVTFTVVDNPGFAPETTDKTEYSYAGRFYTKVTGGFKENYTDVMCDSEKKLTYRERDDFTDTKPKLHVGIDFQGHSNNKVISLISGKVLFSGLLGKYGNSVIVGHSSGKGMYLAAHLSSFNKSLKTGYVSPGDWIGYVGGTGSNGSNEDDKRQYPEHLHVSYFSNYQWTQKKTIIQQNDLLFEIKLNCANPFIHTEFLNE